MKNILVSMQIHSINASFSSNDIFMEKIVDKEEVESLKQMFSNHSSFNFRGEEVSHGILGFYFEDNTYGTDYRNTATKLQMLSREDFFANLGFAIPSNDSEPVEIVETSTEEKIVELLEDVNKELIEGWSFKCYSLEELIELIYEDGEVKNLPNNLKDEEIKYCCDELLEQFENGMDGIREVESLVEALYEVLGLDNPAYC